MPQPATAGDDVISDILLSIFYCRYSTALDSFLYANSGASCPNEGFLCSCVELLPLHALLSEGHNATSSHCMQLCFTAARRRKHKSLADALRLTYSAFGTIRVLAIPRMTPSSLPLRCACQISVASFAARQAAARRQPTLFCVVVRLPEYNSIAHRPGHRSPPQFMI